MDVSSVKLTLSPDGRVTDFHGPVQRLDSYWKSFFGMGFALRYFVCSRCAPDRSQPSTLRRNPCPFSSLERPVPDCRVWPPPWWPVCSRWVRIRRLMQVPLASRLARLQAKRSSIQMHRLGGILTQLALSTRLTTLQTSSDISPSKRVQPQEAPPQTQCIFEFTKVLLSPS